MIKMSVLDITMVLFDGFISVAGMKIQIGDVEMSVDRYNHGFISVAGMKIQIDIEISG